MNLIHYVSLTVLFQGGPGGSGTGFGNFEEIGPLDDDLKPRNTTWVCYVINYLPCSYSPVVITLV